MRGMSSGELTYDDCCESSLRYHGHVNGSITSYFACVVRRKKHGTYG